MKVGLSALVLAVASLIIGLDSGPVHAVTTSIVVSVAIADSQNPGQTVCQSPPTAILSTVGISGGQPITLCVWAKDVSDPQGVGAFEVGFTYNGSLVTVDALTPQTTWLGSTGRAVFCSSSVISPNLPNGPATGAVACGTTNPTPAGPQGMGLIGKVTVRPGTTPGLTTLYFPADTFLMDTGYVQGNTVYSPEKITATVSGVNYRVARCADYNGDQTVRVPDILYIVQRYGTNNAAADLDENGLVLVPDIVISVLQYGRDCT